MMRSRVVVGGVESKPAPFAERNGAKNAAPGKAEVLAISSCAAFDAEA